MEHFPHHLDLFQRFIWKDGRKQLLSSFFKGAAPAWRVIGQNFCPSYSQWTNQRMFNQVATVLLLARGPIWDVTVLQEHLSSPPPLREALSAVLSPPRKVKMPPGPDKTAAYRSIATNLLCSCSHFPVFLPLTFFHLFKDSRKKNRLPLIWCSTARPVVKMAWQGRCGEIMTFTNVTAMRGHWSR